LYPIYRPVEAVDGVVEVRPVVWLMTSEETPHLLMTVDEAAVLLSVDRSAVMGLIGLGALRTVDVAGEVRVSLCALGEYVDSLEGGGR
jgi:excisionase family DNA binding protein